MIEDGLFSANKIERKAAIAWVAKHRKNKAGIHESYTYAFTPTHIGTVVKVICECGKFSNVTDYECW